MWSSSRGNGSQMHCDLLVIGLGYVGLPLAREATAAGMTVVGYDVNPAIVDRLSRGGSHVDDIAADDVAAMLVAGFRATSDESAVGTPETVVICVPTPLSAASGPDLTAVQAAASMVGRLLRPGMLVVLESTTYPGTTDEVLRPVLEAASGLSAGVDFWLAFSPERIDPGNADYGIRNTPKVVGGQTPACAAVAVRFYGKLCDQVVQAASARESPVRPIARKLRARGAIVAYHDPFVPEWSIDGDAVPRVVDLDPELAGTDLVILLQDHRACDLDRVARDAPLILDTRGRIVSQRAEVL